MAAVAGMGLQQAAVAVLVALSAWAVLRHQFPGLARRLRVAVALPLVREGRPAWLRTLGLRIAPRGANAATACGGCSGCGATRR